MKKIEINLNKEKFKELKNKPELQTIKEFTKRIKNSKR